MFVHLCWNIVTRNFSILMFSINIPKYSPI